MTTRSPFCSFRTGPWGNRLAAMLDVTYPLSLRNLQDLLHERGIEASLVRDLAAGPEREGPVADASRPIVIGWGCRDRLCLPRQAARTREAFPSTKLHWFSRCGHFSMWDRPDETVQLILETTAAR